jgi:hypothetical protein
LNQLFDLDLVFGLFLLELSYLFIMQLLKFMQLLVVYFFLLVVLLLDLLGMLFHFFTDYVVFQLFYLILKESVDLLGL